MKNDLMKLVRWFCRKLTYKFHTRPRAGFKNVDGAVALTTLFVAYYNFMRPHGALKGRPPVELECLKGRTLYPDQWVELLRQAGLDAVRRQVA